MTDKDALNLDLDEAGAAEFATVARLLGTSEITRGPQNGDSAEVAFAAAQTAALISIAQSLVDANRHLRKIARGVDGL